MHSTPLSLCRRFFAFALGSNAFRITNTVYGVSNIIYDLGVAADAGVCFGVVATQYVNGIMPHYTIFNVEVSTFAKMANIHMAFMYDMCVCLLLPFIQ